MCFTKKRHNARLELVKSSDVCENYATARCVLLKCQLACLYLRSLKTARLEWLNGCRLAGLNFQLLVLKILRLLFASVCLLVCLSVCRSNSDFVCPAGDILTRAYGRTCQNLSSNTTPRKSDIGKPILEDEKTVRQTMLGIITLGRKYYWLIPRTLWISNKPGSSLEFKINKSSVGTNTHYSFVELKRVPDRKYDYFWVTTSFSVYKMNYKGLIWRLWQFKMSCLDIFHDMLYPQRLAIFLLSFYVRSTWRPFKSSFAILMVF